MKLLATIVILLVIVLGVAGAYYIGVRHVLAPTVSTSTPITSVASTTPPTQTNTTASTSSSYYTDVSAWQTSNQTQAGFSIAYPLDFDINVNNNATPTNNWRLDATNPGIQVLTITVPKAFEPQTNFVDATLTVGYSQNSQAVAACLTPNPDPMTTASTATMHGISYTVFKFSGVGAGQIYKTTSYRTVHAGTCYAVEYTVHSAQLGNFPPSYGLTQYSDPMIDQVLDRIVGTFTFI